MKTLLVQLELYGVIKPLFSYFADFKYKFTTSQTDTLKAFEGERRDFLQAVFQHSKFKKVWGEPDFESLFQHYQCQRSRVITALEYLQEQGFIVLETKKITEVFEVNQTELADPMLAENLQHYFFEKEQSEIKRIATLVRFFELGKCLSNNLSRYFDDNQVPDNCGHCSVCRGQVAKLTYSQAIAWPSDEQLSEYLGEFIDHMKSKNQTKLSVETLSRFLTGLMVPLFSRNKVKQLSGFARCEHIRYQEVREKVSKLC